MNRFLWAVEILNIHPDNLILEIGCGTGTLAGLMAAHLKNGKVTAIDKSSHGISKAVMKNEALINSGNLEFIHKVFDPVDLKKKSFDEIVAFNVNIFQGKGNVSIQDVGKLLKPDGKVYIFYQFPVKLKRSDLLPVKSLMEDHQFLIEEIKIQTIGDSNAGYLRARFEG